jgi:hypothetical protein
MVAGLQSSRFRDRQWVEGLLRHFASYYFDAVDAYDRSDPGTPAVWRYTLDAARRSETNVLQNLFLGINAHINYDLVLAITDVLEPEWGGIEPDLQEVRYRDHCLVNTIIAETIDIVQDEVVERHAPSLDLLDKALGPLDEWMIARMIRGWRDDVWQNALHMLEAPSGPARESLRLGVEARSLDRARRLLIDF